MLIIDSNIDLILGDNDVVEIKTYRPAKSAGMRHYGRILVIDINGITMVRIAGLKEIPTIKVEELK